MARSIIATVLTLLATLVVCQASNAQPINQESAEVATPQKPDASPPDQNPAAKQGGTEESPLVVKILEAPKTEAEAAQEARDREEKSEQDGRLVKFTGDLATYTALLAGVAGLQLLAFAYQGYWLRRTVKSAETTAGRQLRAYVSATPDWIERFSASKVVEIKYAIRNHGQTPAKEMISLAKVDVLPYPLPDNWAFTEPPPNIKGSKSTLYADSPRYARTTMKRLLTSNELASVSGGKTHRIYVYGVIRYLDIFDDEWSTEFCFSLIGSRAKDAMEGRAFYTPDDVVFEASDQHNKTT